MSEPSDTLSQGINLITKSSPFLSDILNSIVNIHASCIINDNCMATFMPPLNATKMSETWSALIDETSTGARFILIYISKVSDRCSERSQITTPSQTSPSTPPSTPHQTPFAEHRVPPIILPNTGETQLEVSGVISFSMPPIETGPFRGTVQKLFVSPHHRHKGIATSLVAHLERHALQRGRWSLMLDTTVGTAGEQLYPKLGYTQLGVVREFGYRPQDGSLADEIFFWKDLREANRLSLTSSVGGE